jgi:hypothetical protein
MTKNYIIQDEEVDESVRQQIIFLTAEARLARLIEMEEQKERAKIGLILMLLMIIGGIVLWFLFK